MEIPGPAIGLLVLVVTGYLIWLVFTIVWEVAEDRGHNPWAWVLVSLCWSPFGSMFVLWLFFVVKEPRNGWKRPYCRVIPF